MEAFTNLLQDLAVTAGLDDLSNAFCNQTVVFSAPKISTVVNSAQPVQTPTTAPSTVPATANAPAGGGIVYPY